MQLIGLPTPIPLVGVPSFGRKYFGAKPGVQNPRFQRAAERGGEAKIDEPAQTSAFQGTTKPTTH
jgi:hypothetical protein